MAVAICVWHLAFEFEHSEWLRLMDVWIETIVNGGWILVSNKIVMFIQGLHIIKKKSYFEISDLC